VLTTGLLYWLLTRTETGKALLATAEDRQAAALMGIDPDRMFALSWGLGAACVGVAGALLKDPDLLILDEPTNGLDPQGMAEMRKLIKDIGQGDRTVLLSSHLLGEVEAICDRVGVISNGRLVTQSTVQELLGEEGVLVRAQPSDAAQEMLTRMFGPEAVSRRDGAIYLKTNPGQSLEINRQLMASDHTM